MMKTDIHKIKMEQAWNRLYDRLDKDHLLVEDHRMPKIPMWVRYGTVAAMEQICALNGISANEIIYPGQVIVLP